MEQITGTLGYIKYHNDENNFTIANLEFGYTTLTVKGSIISPVEGIDYKFTGKIVHDPKFGKQFNFSKYERVQPKDLDAIQRYLQHTATHIGPLIAERITLKYGEQSIEILRTDPVRVATAISGLSLDRAKVIQADLQKHHIEEGVLVQLEKLLGGFGLIKSLPMKAIKLFGPAVVDIITENPYKLIEIKGVGFTIADKLAISRFKIDYKDEMRQRACVIHVLQGNERQGHTWMGAGDLLDECERLTKVNCVTGFYNLQDSESVIVRNNDTLAALGKTFRDEEYIAWKLLKMRGVMSCQTE